MKKRLWATLLSLALIVTLLPSATLATSSDFNIESGLLRVYTGPGGNVVIPEGVTAIGNGVFANRTDLTSVSIPDSVTTIGDGAFHSCTSLTTVVIPEGITYIGHNAFMDTPWLEGLGEFAIVQSILLKYQGQGGDVTIPDGVTSIGPGAFLDCTKLTGVTIPDSVTSIEWNAFGGCTGLTAVTIPDSVTSMGNYAFSQCTNLADITLSNNLTSIQNCAFWFCSSLTNVTIPSRVTSIDQFAFGDCTALTTVTIPDSVTSIEQDAFHDCASLTSVTVPDSVTSIGGSAFWGCTALTDVTLSNQLTSIRYSTFYDCTSLTNVTIPSSVTSIGTNAFEGCTSLRDVTISDGVTKIDGYAFSNCTSLTDVTIPSNVTDIGNRAFSDCDSLRTVKVFSKTARLGSKVFSIDFDSTSPDLTVYSYAGSSTQTFCRKNNITFALLEEPTVPVTGVSLHRNTVSVPVGKITTLIATVKPDDADDKGVYWTSDDTHVVTVDTYGRLTGVKEGTAKVTVTTTDGGFTASCTVTVTKASGSGGGSGSSGGSGSGGGGGSSSSRPSGGSSGGGGGGSTPKPTQPQAPATEQFTDVVKGSWYESGVSFMVEKGLFNGVADKTFAPNTNMTRAMFMTVLARLDGQDTTGGESWYAKGMDWAKASGISDGTMPQSNITREQLVTMLYRYAKAGKTGSDLSKFVDSGKVSDWAKDAMAWAVDRGILTGKGGQRLDPQGAATRAETATILQRFVEKK